MLNTPRMDREANRERMQGARELEEKFGRDFPDSFTFFALDAFGVVCASVLVVLGLWQVEQLIVMDARDGDRSSGRAGPNRQPGLRRAGHAVGDQATALMRQMASPARVSCNSKAGPTFPFFELEPSELR